jgi:hypothetical protein
MESKVDFIIGGVQKGGTTALFEYLSRHPHLSTPPRKELHFFDDENVDWDLPDYAAYHRSFGPSGIRFEATPSYLYWPPSLGRIKTYRVDMKLIFLFRDPIERAFSHWCMGYANGLLTRSFQDMIRAPRRDLGTGFDRHAPRSGALVERGFYGEQVARLLSFFPRRNVLLLRSEDLIRDPQTALNRVTDFVGIDSLTVRPMRVYERTPMNYPSRLETNDITYLRGVFAPDLARFARLSGIDTTDWLAARAE